MADCRYRGQCNEGGEYQPNMMEIIDFQPKIGMNVFMMEFDNPKAYYDFYYNANHNHTNRDAEPVNAVTTKQWKRQCEAELSKRSLQFHDMGHGWTAEPFGLDSSDGWVKGEQANLESARQYLAQVNGVRELWGGVALNTQFCMSNPEARTIVAKYVTEYAYKHQNADYLHVWLADGSHNHCECDECRKKTPSDWYVMLMNEIDERLTARDLSTRVVFICYTDTTWAPLEEKIKNLSEPKKQKDQESQELPEEYFKVLEIVGKYFENNISLKRGNGGKGTMTIHFKSDDEVKRFLSALEDSKFGKGRE